jgi:hypothetical protein
MRKLFSSFAVKVQKFNEYLTTGLIIIFLKILTLGNLHGRSLQGQWSEATADLWNNM